MPRVSQQYRDERRAEILDAARTCFARDGFHQTSMQDLFAEAGLSAGAVYRYFPGKAAVIVAIAEENLRGFVSILREATSGHDDRPLGHIIADVMDAIRERQRGSCVGGIALTVWAEGVRDAEIATELARAIAPVRDELTALVERHQAAGRLPDTASAAGVAATLLTLVPGYIMQLTLYGEDAVADVPATLRALWAS